MAFILPTTRHVYSTRRRMVNGAVWNGSLLGILLASVVIPAGAQSDCRGHVYLSFDTGNMAQAEDIARVLREEKVKASFFVANEKTKRGDYSLDASWADYWRTLVADGHTFGNHTWHHWYARRDLDSNTTLFVDGGGREHRLTRDSYCAELRRSADAFEKMTGQRLAPMWRAPGGRTTHNSLRWAASCGYPVHVHWHEAGVLGDELASDTHPNERLLKRALRDIEPGTITLMHLGVWSRREPLVPILKPLIQGLKQRGLCFAPLAVAAP